MVIPPFGLLFLSIIQDNKPSPGKQKGYSRTIHQADKVPGTDSGYIDARKSFFLPDTFFRPVWAKLAAKLLRGDCEELLTAED